jgi:hypothetical protein
MVATRTYHNSWSSVDRKARVLLGRPRDAVHLHLRSVFVCESGCFSGCYSGCHTQQKKPLSELEPAELEELSVSAPEPDPLAVSESSSFVFLLVFFSAAAACRRVPTMYEVVTADVNADVVAAYRVVCALGLLECISG